MVEKNILVLGEGLRQGLDNATITEEAKIILLVLQNQEKIFVLNLHLKWKQ